MTIEFAQTFDPGSANYWMIPIVEGAGCDDPGRIREIKVAPGCSTDPWLEVKWRMEGKVIVGLEAVAIDYYMGKKGAFLLQEACEDEGLTGEWSAYKNFMSVGLGRGTPFPVDKLPKRVQALIGTRKKKSTSGWDYPEPEAKTEPEEKAKRGRPPKA